MRRSKVKEELCHTRHCNVAESLGLFFVELLQFDLSDGVKVLFSRDGSINY